MQINAHARNGEKLGVDIRSGILIRRLQLQRLSASCVVQVRSYSKRENSPARSARRANNGLSHCKKVGDDPLMITLNIVVEQGWLLHQAAVDRAKGNVSTPKVGTLCRVKHTHSHHE
jgi:hypothetical protein